MEKTVEVVCKRCDGTGLYQGMAERDGFAVVCHNCGGTGHTSLVYEAWDGSRRHRDGVKQVIERNPGFICGVNSNLGLSIDSFGGMPYEAWSEGKKFAIGMEMRGFVCPNWWHQGSEQDLTEDMNCPGRQFGETFSECSKFCKKEECWKKYDKLHETEILKNTVEKL